MSVNTWTKFTSVATVAAAVALILASASLEVNAFSLSTQSTYPRIQPRQRKQQQQRQLQRQLEQDTVELYGNKNNKRSNRPLEVNKVSPATLLRPMTRLGVIAAQEPNVRLQKIGASQHRAMGAKELEELYLRSATRRTTPKTKASASASAATKTPPTPTTTEIPRTKSVTKRTTGKMPRTTTRKTTATATAKIPRTPKTSSTDASKAVESDLENAIPLALNIDSDETIQENLREKQKTIKNGGLLTRSRSSTMPGLSGGARSDKQLAYRDGVRLVEQRTGKKVKETSESKMKRKATNGESMYKTSACVPESMVQFANEIHQIDRITRKEEIFLGEKTQEAMQLQKMYSKLSDTLAREPTDEEWCAAAGKINMEAVRQTIEEGLEAKNKLVTSNLRMVQSVVNTYIRNGLGGQYNAGDMMQEGVMALIRAAEKFEPERGWRFSTYALYWIRASVKRTQIFQSRIVSVPQRLYENHKRLLRVEKEMALVLGRKPTKFELGEAVGMSELQVTRCMTAMDQRCYSLDRSISNSKKPMSGDKGGDTLNDLVQSKTDDGEHTKCKRVLLREDLIETLHRYISPEEVELLLLRYGLKDGPSHKLGGQPTIAELSEMVGLKPDKVRRIIEKSLRQLKTAGGDEWLALSRDM
jgi:RNA polymerase primary sigma factor